MPHWIDRLLGRKQADLPFSPRYASYGGWDTALPTPSFARLTKDGYAQNAAVFACINALAFGYQQPKIVVQTADGEKQPQHPLQRLLDRPNPIMSWAELALYIATYKAIGGNVYLHKIRIGGKTVELWPYHAGQITPRSQGTDWIAWYDYDDGTGDLRRIDPADMIHLKWPAINPALPWLGLPPLLAIAYEVETDTEATRYLFSLLKNDAMPRTILTLPANTQLSPVEMDAMRSSFQAMHGRERRGGVGIAFGGATVTRASLDVQELAFDALRKVPEARICAAFRVPPEYVGLNVGLENSTYSNKQEARRGFIEDTIMQLCSLDAAELTADLGAEYSNVIITHDFAAVVGLQENENDKYTRALNAFEKVVITRNEARRMIGLPPVEALGIAALTGAGDTFMSDPLTAAAPAAAGAAGAAAPPTLAVGDRVTVAISPPHMPGQTTGTVAEVGGTAYGIIFDGMESMGVHKWYVADELQPASAPPDTPMPMGKAYHRKARTRATDVVALLTDAALLAEAERLRQRVAVATQGA